MLYNFGVVDSNKSGFKEMITLRLNEKIQIVSHNPKWKQDYIEEVKLLKNSALLSKLHYEHIGSTSIPNIKAKPIIDIIVGVESMPPSNDIICIFEQFGYIFMREMNVIDRLYFIKREDKNFNLHIILYKGEIWENDILFRDYMINNPNEAQQYSSLKEKILNTGIDTLLEYSELKANFISEIYKKMK